MRGETKRCISVEMVFADCVKTRLRHKNMSYSVSPLQCERGRKGAADKLIGDMVKLKTNPDIMGLITMIAKKER